MQLRNKPTFRFDRGSKKPVAVNANKRDIGQRHGVFPLRALNGLITTASSMAANRSLGYRSFEFRGGLDLGLMHSMKKGTQAVEPAETQNKKRHPNIAEVWTSAICEASHKADFRSSVRIPKTLASAPLAGGFTILIPIQELKLSVLGKNYTPRRNDPSLALRSQNYGIQNP